MNTPPSREPAKNAGLRWIETLTRTAVRRPNAFLAAAAIVVCVSVWLSAGLEIRSSFEELLPADVPSVATLKELIRRVGGDGTVLITIEATLRREDMEAAKALAPRLAEEYLALGPETIRSVEYNVRPVEAWYSEHWPMFASLEDLEKARDVVKAEVSRAKRKANPLLDLAGEEVDTSTAPTTASWLDPEKLLPREEVLARFARYEDGFLLHPDGRSLTMVVRPAGTALGVAEARALIDRMRAIANGHQGELDAHDLRVGFGGTFPMFVAEYEAIIGDVRSTALLCVSLVLVSIIIFFRDLRSSISLAIAVLAGVAVTFGLTRLAIGYLNTQTAFLGSIVVGNGINYGLIYLARVKQLRNRGVALESACVEGATTAARATLLASLATSVAFGTLLIAANRGFRHFGFIGGIGMVLCWVATFALVPALLSIAERRFPVVPADGRDAEERVPSFVRVAFARPRMVAAVFAVLGLVSLMLFVRFVPRAIERNLSNLTNELEGVDALLRDNDRAQAGLGKSIAGAIALLGSREDADAFCVEVRKRQAAEERWSEVIQGCDTMSGVVPSHQEEKLALIGDIARRLSDGVLEKLPEAESARLRTVREQLRAQRTITVEEAPPTLIDRFKERDGTVGRLAVVTARPLAKLELAPNLAAFVDGVRSVPVGRERVDATGENVIFSDLLANIDREGPIATVISFLGVCVLVAIFFRRARMTFEVIASLFVGVLLMCGVAALMELRINFFNFIVFPITFGIAVDYGANVIVRVKERGGRVLEALVEVGPAVILCSWTTIIGYGTLLFALNRALQSFGWYAIIGEFTTLATALILLPARLLDSER